MAAVARSISLIPRKILKALRSLARGRASPAGTDSTGEQSSWPSEDTAAQNAHNELIERQLAAVGGTVRAVSFYYVEWTV